MEEREEMVKRWVEAAHIQDMVWMMAELDSTRSQVDTKHVLLSSRKKVVWIH